MGKHDGYFRTRWNVDGIKTILGKVYRKVPAPDTTREHRCEHCDLLDDWERCRKAGTDCQDVGYIYKEER